jgi:hypothetical protein
MMEPLAEVAARSHHNNQASADNRPLHDGQTLIRRIGDDPSGAGKPVPKGLAGRFGRIASIHAAPTSNSGWPNRGLAR